MRRFAIILGVLTAMAAPAQASQLSLGTGKLTSWAGGPAQGATVTAYLEPRSVKGVRTLRKVATATTAADGSYELLGDAAALRHAAHHGWVDLFLEAEDGRMATVATVSRNVADRGRSSASGPALPALEADVPLDAQPRGSASAASNKCSNGATYGSPKRIHIDSKRAATPLGELFNAYKDTTAYFDFTTGAQTVVATQYSAKVNGKFASFGASGSKTLTEGTTNSRSWHHKGKTSRMITTSVRYDLNETRTCGNSGGKTWRTIAAKDGTQKGLGLPKTTGGLKQCDGSESYPGGTDWSSQQSKTTTTARTFGFTIAGFGVETTSQSNFSSSVGVRYQFRGGPDKRHYICGPNGSSAEVGDRIFSGRRR